jgi:ligand-binding sensor domain-containing protein
VAVATEGSFQGDTLGNQFNLTVMSIESDGAGRVFLGCVGGLIVVDGALNVRRITEQEGLPQRTPQALYFDTRGRLWAGTWGGGIVQIDAKQNAVSAASALTGKFQVRRIVEDSSGTLWCGAVEGLWRLTADRWEPARTPSGFKNIAVVATVSESIAAQMRVAWRGSASRVDR